MTGSSYGGTSEYITTMIVYHVVCVQHLPSGSSKDACGVAAPLCRFDTASADVNSTLSTEHSSCITASDIM